MAAATHMLGSNHSSSSSSISPSLPWHPLVLEPNHQHHDEVLYDLDLATPSPTTPGATASPPRQNHNHLRPAASRQRAGKPRRPRQKLPTTYIIADAASFRRMVHQVTGADDVLLRGPAAALEPEILFRPAPAPPSRGALTTTTTTMLTLPTLDTSAFLMLGAAGGGVGRGGAPPARPGVSWCHGSPAAAANPGLQVKVEACGSDGFPSLELWDEDDTLF